MGPCAGIAYRRDGKGQGAKRSARRRPPCEAATRQAAGHRAGAEKAGRTGRDLRGYAVLHVGKSGTYRVAANEAADIDVVGSQLSGKPLVKHGPVCSTIAQVEEMKLHSGDIVIQLTNAQHSTLDVLAIAVDPDDSF